MTEIHPFREAIIPGMAARALVMIQNPQTLRPKPTEMMSVKDAWDIEKAMGDPENIHHCPLCSEFFPTEAFRQHAPQCIEARMPRQRIWTPPGFSYNAVQHYSEERPTKPDATSFYDRV